MSRIRILHVTSTPPIPTWGGSMAFYRHFCERGDFEILVITDNPQVCEHNVPYRYFLINRGRIWRRVTTTRLYKIGHTLGHFVTPDIQNPEIWTALNSFRPQAVFTVAGSWSWMALLARKFARKLDVPLIGSFNDWWYYNTIRFESLDGLLDRQFRNFYKACELAICTSEGMRTELGAHHNAVVVYPSGANADTGTIEVVPRAGKFTVAFAGNLGEWYGLMLEQLISLSQPTDHIMFKIYGSNAQWSAAFDNFVRATQIYGGHLPFSELKQKIKETDALLLLMGFDARIAQIEKTSFKTKFLDYIALGKPILLWGPSYCTAVAVAREFDSAEICVSENPQDFLNTINALRKNITRQKTLVENARRMYTERFHPDKIHAVLLHSIKTLVRQRSTP